MSDLLDLNVEDPLRSGIASGELSEGSFEKSLSGNQFPFQNKFGIGGDIQVAVQAFCQFERLPFQRRGNLIFSYSSSAYSWNVVRSLLERGVVQTRSIITHREEFGNFRNAFETLTTDNSVKTVLFHKNS